ncbi:MAG TPA: MerR family transcriptional regulator [Isosphaeraceae bacterium]|jgi:DNA-binding transcriptional MerR regulator|nr:MerR family transcriptional regulator [Isosphaeraceae bacterium]
MTPAFWKVGELARATGVSVRALHYYEEVGLLIPSHRTEAGYRLYGEADIARLQQIKSLRQLGFSLEEVSACLREPEFSALRVVEQHLARLREQLVLQQDLCRRLERIAAHLRLAEKVSAEELLQTIEGISMIEKYYTPEQLAEIKERGKQMGEEQIRQSEAEWQQIIDQIRAHMQMGTDSSSEEVQKLGRRCSELLREFTGGNPEIQKSLNAMWSQESNIAGYDTREMRAMMSYVFSGLPKTS